LKEAVEELFWHLREQWDDMGELLLNLNLSEECPRVRPLGPLAKDPHHRLATTVQCQHESRQFELANVAGAPPGQGVL
jgi:hypothetical protein